MIKNIYLKPADENSWKMLVELAIEKKKSASSLAVEAIRDLLWKYEEQRLKKLKGEWPR